MYRITLCHKALLAILLGVIAATAWAEPGDDEAVAKARRDYENALKTNDVGLRNAMKIELSVQLAKAKERKEKDAAGKQEGR